MSYPWSRYAKNGHKENAITKPVKHGKEIPIKSDESEEDIELELERAKKTIQALEATLKERDCEIRRILIKLDENTTFLQKTVMELIQLKASTPPAPAVSPAVAAYLAKKNERESDNTKKGKLP